MTTLALIETARNPDFKALNQAEITKRLAEVMSGAKLPRTIAFVDPKAALTIAQLYIEYYLNEAKLAEAADFAKDALELA